MPLTYVIPGLFVAWVGWWYYQSKSSSVALAVSLRLAVVLGIIYLGTRLVWLFLVPKGVCPITTPPLVLILSILVPLGMLVGFSSLASYFPQLIETRDGYALLVGEDFWLTKPVAIERAHGDHYLITDRKKTHKVRLRGERGKRVAALLGHNAMTDMD